MSSRFSRICLSHTPPLDLGENLSSDLRCSAFAVEALGKPEGHPNCVIGLGRFSYPLIEIWLPGPGMRGGGHWFDVTWMRDHPGLVEAIMTKQI